MRGDGRSHKRVVALSSRKARIAQAMNRASDKPETPNTLPTTVPVMPRRAITSCKRSGAAMSVRHIDRRRWSLHRRRVVEAQDDENRERERDEQMVGSIVRRHGCARGNGRDGQCG
jgi:hypothetical protein